MNHLIPNKYSNVNVKIEMKELDIDPIKIMCVLL